MAQKAPSDASCRAIDTSPVQNTLLPSGPSLLLPPSDCRPLCTFQVIRGNRSRDRQTAATGCRLGDALFAYASDWIVGLPLEPAEVWASSRPDSSSMRNRRSQTRLNLWSFEV